MAQLLAGSGLIVVLFGAVSMWMRRRRARYERPVIAPDTDPVMEEPRGPISRNAYWAPDQKRRRSPRGPGTAEHGEEPEYRVKGGSSESTDNRWNPFDPSVERRERVRAARHREPGSRSREHDYYALLGLEHGASDRAIEQAYRARVAKLHPDQFFDDPVRRKDAEEQLKALNSAMQVLRDPVRKALYDASG